MFMGGTIDKKKILSAIEKNGEKCTPWEAIELVKLIKKLILPEGSNIDTCCHTFEDIDQMLMTFVQKQNISL